MGTCFTKSRTGSGRRNVIENYTLTNANTMMSSIEIFAKENALIDFKCVHISGKKKLEKIIYPSPSDCYDMMKEFELVAIFVVPIESGKLRIIIAVGATGTWVQVCPYRTDGKTLDESLMFEVIASSNHEWLERSNGASLLRAGIIDKVAPHVDNVTRCIRALHKAAFEHTEWTLKQI